MDWTSTIWTVNASEATVILHSLLIFPWRWRKYFCGCKICSFSAAVFSFVEPTIKMQPLCPAERCLLEVLHVLSKITDWTWSCEYGSSWICSLEQGPVPTWNPFVFHWFLTWILPVKSFDAIFFSKYIPFWSAQTDPDSLWASEEPVVLYMGLLSWEQALLLTEVSGEKMIWKT